MRAHAYFDLVWKKRIMNKHDAYCYLLKGKPINELNTKQCNKLVDKLKVEYPQLYKGKEYLDNELFYS